MDGDWKCALCGDVIGVYEPMIVVDGDCQERRTSRAAGSVQGHEHGARYHEACRPQAGAEPSKN